MKKRIISLLLCLVLIVSLVPAAAAADTGDARTVTVRYASGHGVDTHDYETDFTYSDDLFTKSGYTYRKDLALMSMGLAFAAYTSKDSEKTDDYATGNRNFVSMAEQCGFANIQSNKWMFQPAVADSIGGSEAVFAEQMSRRAAELGMNNTHYVNACGLDAPGHVSSARDVAILSREMLTKHPDITEYTTIWTDSLRGGQTKLVNTNKLLRRYAGTNGLKTGTTSGAGVCITASASRDGLDLIAVVLGAADSAQRFAAAKALLDYGFANFENGQIEKPENAPESLPVSGGESENAVLQYALPARLLLKKGEGAALQTTAQLPEVLSAPLEEGQKVGSVCVKIGESVLAEYPVCAAKAVPRLKMYGAWLHILHGMTAL